MAWGTFPLPVGTSKPEVGYFAMKPTIFRYQILPWVIKKWFRVHWVTFQYSWNRKYWWKPEVFVNFNLWLHISYVTYAINISYDCKFYCCFHPFSLKLALNTHAIIFLMPITVKSLQIRGGPTFDPVKYVKEVVTWTICMPTHFDPPEFLFDINDHMTQFHRKLTFDPPSLVRSGSKVSFRSVWKRIKSRFSMKLSPVIINFEEKFGWIKSESACICFTWLTSFTYFTGSKFGPPRTLQFQMRKFSCWTLRTGWLTYIVPSGDSLFCKDIMQS